MWQNLPTVPILLLFLSVNQRVSMSKTGITKESLLKTSGSASQQAVARRLLMRRLIDKLATKCIGLGGISIILAVMLIFVFLFSEIIPMFSSAKVDQIAQSQFVKSNQRLLAVDTDDRGEFLMRLFEDEQGQTLYFNKFDNLQATKSTNDAALKLPFKVGQEWIYDSLSGLFVTESDGLIHLGRFKETEKFDDDGRTLVPRLTRISPEQGFPLKLNGPGDIELLQIKALSNAVALSYKQVNADSSEDVYLQVWKKSRSLLSRQSKYKSAAHYKLPINYRPNAVYIDNQLRWSYVVSDDRIEILQLKSNGVKRHSEIQISQGITASSMLLGSKSLLIGDSKGAITQWSLIRDDDNKFTLKALRVLQHSDAPIAWIQPEDRRRGFYALDQSGELGLFFTTSERKLANWSLDAFDIAQTKLISSPRSNTLLAFDEQQIAIFDVKNEHPEVSFKSMWQKVWYEGYESPEYIWQSSAATNDFEPKLSLSPLAYGTLKATFYAMLFALPLAICGAIYTAYFMATAVRKKVKPCIEFMEALPTVILGFLAGIWLAPLVENYLPGVLLTILLLPVVMLSVSLAWYMMPKNIRLLLPDGWEPVFLVPFILLAVFVCFQFSYPLEQIFFDGDVKIWMRDTLGISYDQRNSLVVGIAMGFAVIPTIFSIAEDAVFAVPKSLTFGSLALGASPWQTLVRVVLPTASPGIFSAVMIGTGRAVGETMIVLMATGSTPIMDMNIFEGFRTLSANIAIEMPEAEVHSTHYRLLFFAAFCLFMFTFVFNTTAEIVRQRLREKYGSL